MSNIREYRQLEAFRRRFHRREKYTLARDLKVNPESEIISDVGVGTTRFDVRFSALIKCLSR